MLGLGTLSLLAKNHVPFFQPTDVINFVCVLQTDIVGWFCRVFHQSSAPKHSLASILQPWQWRWEWRRWRWETRCSECRGTGAKGLAPAFHRTCHPRVDWRCWRQERSRGKLGGYICWMWPSLSISKVATIGFFKFIFGFRWVCLTLCWWYVYQRLSFNDV